MKDITSTLGQFAIIYFIIIALLYVIGLFVPAYWPSFLHSEVLIPVTLIYLIAFFGFKYFKKKKNENIK